MQQAANGKKRGAQKVKKGGRRTRTRSPRGHEIISPKGKKKPEGRKRRAKKPRGDKKNQRAIAHRAKAKSDRPTKSEKEQK